MRCADVDRLMGLFLDSELSSETAYEIEQHLKGCPACAARMEKERNLETQMRGLLIQERSGDDEAWDRAVQGLRQTRRKMWKLRLLAPIAAVFLAAFVLLWPRAKGPELDLALAAASDHAKFLREIQAEAPAADPMAAFAAAAHVVLATGARIPSEAPAGYAPLKAGRCTLRGRPVAYLTLKYFRNPVTLFLMEPSSLQRFPAASARLSREPDGVSCRVGPSAFFLERSPDALACGIGGVSGQDLRQLVDWALVR